ncbi:hypothetical protein MMC32_007096 [Xylographa parallela]|nr:hypothetical protein [Xylographa parallela]
MAIPEIASQSVPQLFCLPAELQAHIFGLLPFATLQVLHATHHKFRQIIDLDPSKYCQRHNMQENGPPYIPVASEMLTTAVSDPFLKRRNLKPCAYCLRLRSVAHFSKKKQEIEARLHRILPRLRVEPEAQPFKARTKCGEFEDRPRQLEEERQKEEKAQRATAERKTARRQRNAVWKEIRAGSDYDDFKSDSTVEETPSEAELRMIQSEAAMDGLNYDG